VSTNPTYADEAAFPQPEILRHDGEVLFATQWGLTRREYFAALAMQGFCANAEIARQAMGKDMGPFITQASIACADDLLRHLKVSPGGAP